MCDVGAKSTFRCLKTYYKCKVADLITNPNAKNKNIQDNIERFVEQLRATAPCEVPAADLNFHLTALLQAKSSNLMKVGAARGTINKRIAKIQRKINNTELINQTQFVEKVLYQTNVKLVTDFLTIPANHFLLRVFTQEDGLSNSDQNSPACRRRELHRMLEFQYDTN